MTRLRSLLAILLLAMAVVGQWAVLTVNHFLNTPAQTPGQELLVVVERDQRPAALARRLAEQGLVSDAEFFRWYMRARQLWAQVAGQAPGQLRVGEYRLNSGWTPRQILDELLSGRVVLRRLTVPEGLPWWEVARLVEASGLASAEAFGQALHDRQLLARLHVPAPSAEGYLFPETYLLSRNLDGDARPVVEAMVRQFMLQARQVWPQEQGGMPDAKRLHEVLILASLVEKETAVAAERPRVAGVYANRLRLGMTLDCDPTIIYGLGPGFSGNLTRADLQDATNPYNTYVHKGLPPGPIASPGLQALLAAAAPEANDLLYFVSRGDGSHQFSRTLDEHHQAVRAYLQLRRAQSVKPADGPR